LRNFYGKILAIESAGNLNMKMNFGWDISLGALLVAFATSANALTVQNLRCEYCVNPLGIDTQKPRLSWTLAAERRGETQTAYQIVVATTPEKLKKPDLWNSGKVMSADSVHVVYAGSPLKSGQRVYWKVRAWDRDGKSSAQSEAAWWEMGLVSPGDWKASWITRKSEMPATHDDFFNDHPAPLFRKEFSLPKKIARARIYVTGLGYYELRLNGKKVGDQVLDPGWTDFSKRVLYSTYDVTESLHQGTNAIGVMLGNGWFNPLPLKMWGKINPRDALTIGEPRLILQLAIEFSDGTSQLISTDETWKTSDGPILRNSVYLGEVYDARKEQTGWDKAAFDDSKWESAVLAKEKLGELRAQDAPPIRVTRVLKPVKISQPKNGVNIVDFGQNFSGVARLRVKGAAGTRVRLRYGELLYPDGTLNGMTSVCGQIKGGGKDYVYDGKGQPKTAFQIDEYILKGEGEEMFTPRFTFHGFRYVEVTGFPGALTLDSVEGLRLNSDVMPVGEFSCSNEMFNRIQEMTLWTQLANMFSVQSDCPHREKFGYGGDLVVASEMGICNFDMARFYAKVVDDFADAARPNGGFTETAPFVGISDFGLGEDSGPVGWGTAHPLLVWQLYQYYGDKRLLEQHYDAAKRWLELLKSKAQDGILDNGISDHESLVPKPRALTGTAFYYFNAAILSKIAQALGKFSDAAGFEKLAGEIKTAFNKKFLDESSGKYDSGTQCCQAFALYMGLTPENQKHGALQVLVNDIQQTHNGHLSTGIFGTKYMLHALADVGRADVAYEIVNQKTFPGWGHMLENGATTLWEHWEFSDNTYSHNHPMFGSVSEWFYKVIGGINPAPDAVGFDKIIIRPQPVGDLTWAKASYNSVRGIIVSEWERKGDVFKLHVVIPPNTKALVHIPASKAADVSENGKPVKSSNGVTFVRMVGRTAVFSIGSGDYRFATGK
jgi:alpha-L-rhamnosidase